MSNGVVTFAIPWLVFRRTGSVSAAGLVAALSALPSIVASPFAGAMVGFFSYGWLNRRMSRRMIVQLRVDPDAQGAAPWHR